MRTDPSFTPKQFSSYILPEKFYIVLLAVLLGFSGSLSASTGLVNKAKNKPVGKAAFHNVKTVGLPKKTPAITPLKKPGIMGLPAVSYVGPQIYVAGAAITPLLPTGGGAAAPGYGSGTTTVGSGFNEPTGIAVDSKGNVYVANQNSNQVMEIPGGTGTPVVIGTGFSAPEGLAVDARGNVYVADNGDNQVKEIPLVNGAYGTPVVLAGGSGPQGIAIDTKGNIYVTNSGGAVQEIPVGGGTAITLGSGFVNPKGLAVDAYGNVYVGDIGNGLVKKIPAGNGAMVTLGPGFAAPFGLAVDGSGNVFVADYGEEAVDEIPVNGGAVMTVGPRFGFVYGVAADNANNVYVTDFSNNAVDKVQPSGGYYISPELPKGLIFNNTTGAISGTPVAASPATTYTVTAYNQYGGNSTTLSITVNAVTMSYASPQVYNANTTITPLSPTGGGAAAPAYSGSTTILGSGFNQPYGVAVDAKGNVFIGDRLNNEVKEIPGGTATPIIIAKGFSSPMGVAEDALGNLYVADEANNKVKEIPLVNGVYGTPVGLGASFTFSDPTGIAVDTKGNVYVANSGTNQIEKIPAGGGTVSAVGTGFNDPSGVAVDAYGNVYVADQGNDAVKEIPAGNGAPVTLGSDFGSPWGVAVDGSGNVFVADEGNSAVYEIPVNGSAVMMISSRYVNLFGVAVDNANNVYVTDFGTNTVNKIQPTGGYYISPGLPLGLSFNNTTGAISGTPAAASPATTYTVTAYNQYGSNSTTVNITVNAVTMSYASPQIYNSNTTITPLAPTGGGAAAPAYSTSATALGSGFHSPWGVAVDSKGNVFVGDYANNVVKEIPGGTGVPIVIATGFISPSGVAVDAQGNVYVADKGNFQVKEVPLVNGTYDAPVVLGASFSFSQPEGVAVDAAGNVYVADAGLTTIEEIPTGGGAVIPIATGFSSPSGVAVDIEGDIYVADPGQNAVIEIPTRSGGTQVALGSGFNSPTGVAVDGSGNVFVADAANHKVKEIPVNGAPVITISSGLTGLRDVAVDNANNVYATNVNTVIKVQPTGGYYINPRLPFGLSFNNTTGAISGISEAVSPATAYTVTAYNQYGSNSTTVNITVNAITISYAGPQTYVAGTAITPLAPSGGSLSPSYGTFTTLGPSFNAANGVAVDPKGNVFVGSNITQVEEIPGGTGTPIIIGGGFAQPIGVAVDAAGNVYVADWAHVLVKEIPLVNGTFGTPVVLGSSFTFRSPEGVAVDTKGNVYVADEGFNTIEEIPAGGGTVITLGSGLSGPTSVAVDAYGNVYMVDDNNVIKEIPAGNGAVVTLSSAFSLPSGLAVDGSGNIFVADYGAKTVNEIPVNGGAIFQIGNGFTGPGGVAVDNADNLYVTDAGSVIKVQPTGGCYVSPALPKGLSFNNTTGAISGTPVAASPPTNYTITTYNLLGGNSTTVNIAVNAVTMSYAGPQTYVAGTAITPLGPTGGGAAAPGYSSSPAILGLGFNNPTGVAADAAGNIYVADYRNNLVKKIPAGSNTPVIIATTISFPYDVAVDAAGDVYVAGFGGSAVYKIPGGSGTPVPIGSGFNTPTGVAIDAAGDVYVADYGNNKVKKIPAGSNTPAIIGSGFSEPIGVAVDAQGNVYVGDYGNSAVKEIPAGSNTPVIIGSNFTNPAGVAVDASGNVYVGDYGNSEVKMIPAGNGTPVVIGGTTGFSHPNGVGVDGAGNVYVADYTNNAVKQIKPIGGYYIGPFLPNGLSFNNTTGAIGGTPAAASPATTYTVTAYNQYGGNSTTVNLGVTANAYLSALSLSTGTLSPVFSTGATTYTVNVANGTTSITVTPTAADPSATIVVNGSTVATGTASQSLPLVAGPNTITILVISRDGMTTRTYTLVASTASTDASLSNLKTSTGSLSPAFATTTTGYTESVANSVSSITVTPYAASSAATVKVNGTTVTSGTASGAIALAAGANVISTVVTSKDGTITQTYKVTVTRAVTVNANLSALKLSNGALSPGFSASTITYVAGVGNGVASMTVTPTAADPTATITVNGTAVTSGSASQSLPLAVGPNAINTVVTAQDGTTIKTYAVTVTRAPSTNASLSAFKLSNGILSPAFSASTITYAAGVGNGVAFMKVTPTVADPNATITVNGTAVTSGSASQSLPLAVGPNAINTVVTAQDGTTIKTYAVTVTRAPSTNASLSAFKLSNGILSPAFSASTITYAAGVGNGVASMKVTPTAADPNATITVNGTAVTSGSASQSLPLVVGPNNITTIVTAQDGVTIKTYNLVVTVAKSTNANLLALKPTPGPLSPAFSATTTAYNESVANTVSTITITPTTAVNTSTVTVNGTAVTSGTASGSIILAVGPNKINTVVTAQDGTTTKTYTVTVTRAAGGADSYDPGISVTKPTETPTIADDGIVVHQGVSPNGDGINDFLQIDNISQYPDNKLMIMNRNGQLIFEAKGYDNSSKVFDGHSSKNGQMQLPGTYFYQLDYTVDGITKHKTGFLVLKY